MHITKHLVPQILLVVIVVIIMVKHKLVAHFLGLKITLLIVIVLLLLLLAIYQVVRQVQDIILAVVHIALRNHI